MPSRINVGLEPSQGRSAYADGDIGQVVITGSPR